MTTDDYKKWYEEAMVASNEAGFACVSAADTIRRQDAHIQELRAKLDEVHSWIVCAAIASPADMMQSAARIEEVTRP